MLSYCEMMRLGNCIMTSVAVFIGGLLIFRWNLDVTPGFPVFTAMLAAFLIAGAGNVINDVVDKEADAVNRPKRPLPSGRANRGLAIVFAVALFVAGNFLAAIINWMALFIAALNSVALIAYSAWLQHKVYVGNLAVSYLVGSSFLFGGAAMGNIYLPLILAAMAFFANFSREVIKDLEDIEGDRFCFLRKIAAKLRRKAMALAERFSLRNGRPELAYNPKTAVIIAIVSLLFAIAISPLPWLLGILKLPYLAMLIPADIVMVGAILRLYLSASRSSLSAVSKMIKAGMCLGLLAFVAGVLL